MAAIDFSALFGQMSQQPRRLSLGDLYQPAAMPSFPEMPQQATGLDDNQRRDYRTQMILALAGAVGQGSQDGRYGDAIARGAQGLSGLKDQMLAEENARREREYLTAKHRASEEMQVRQAEAEEAQRLAQAKGRLGLYERILTAEPGMADRAESLAMGGDDQGLMGLLGEIPGRQAIRDRGGNPDDPFADEEIKAQIAHKAKMAQEEALRAGGYDGYHVKPERPLAERVDEQYRLAEASARGYAQHRAPSGGGGQGSPGRFFERGDELLVGRFGEDGEPEIVRPRGGPEGPAPKWKLVTPPGHGQKPYLVDVNTGATKPVEAPGGQAAAAPPAPPPEPPGLLDRLFGRGSVTPAAPRKAPPAIEKPAKAPTQGSAGAPIDLKVAEAKKKLPDLDRAEEVAVRAFLRQKGTVAEAIRRVQQQRQKRGQGAQRP